MKKQYKIIKIPKGHGKFRTIYAPSKDYKEKLTTLLLDLQQKVHNADEEMIIHGFIRGRGAVTNALKHVGYAYTLSFDLENFFDSVRVEMVEKHLCSEALSLCFIDGVARQGLPTSPLMANLAFLEFDKKIKEAIGEMGVYTAYTRYADDLIFSFNQKEFAETLKETIIKIIDDSPFTLNSKKTKLQDAKNGRRIITGIGVGERKIYPSRKIKRKIRAAKHQKNRESALALLSWASCREPKPFYTDRDLLNKHIFEEEALDVSNDFYLSDLLSFEAYVEQVEKDFSDTTVVHEKDRQKWSKQKEAFLEQRSAFYKREKAVARREKENFSKTIKTQFYEETPTPQATSKKEQKKGIKRETKAATKQTHTTAAKKVEVAVDFDALREIEHEEAMLFQDQKASRRREKEKIQAKAEKVEVQNRSLNRIFLSSMIPIVLLLFAMGYYFANAEVEVKPTYPLFVSATPYGTNIKILNIKPKYEMGIELKPGQYEIYISKEGFEPQKFWVTMEHQPLVITKELKRINKRKIY